jgi:ABC-type microcin C transport system permease subunit YejB
MLSYMLRRLALTIPVLLCVATLVFPLLGDGLRDWLSPR